MNENGFIRLLGTEFILLLLVIVCMLSQLILYDFYLLPGPPSVSALLPVCPHHCLCISLSVLYHLLLVN